MSLLRPVMLEPAMWVQMADRENLHWMHFFKCSMKYSIEVRLRKRNQNTAVLSYKSQQFPWEAERISWMVAFWEVSIRCLNKRLENCNFWKQSIKNIQN